MLTDIRSILNDKHILILGFGMEGQSTYKLLRSYFPLSGICIADRDDSLLIKHPSLINDQNLKIYCGEDYLGAGPEVDLVIKSPGIPFDLVKEYFPADKITSQTDIFLKAYSDQVIGVTGTKGKSTTSTLIYHLLKYSGRKVVLSGNIGRPAFNLISEIDTDTEVVFEMSSHQLEQISIAPQTAVLLNIFPEHLDHYKDFTAYKMAKFNISRQQPGNGILIYDIEDQNIKGLLSDKDEDQLFSFSRTFDPSAAASSDGENIYIHYGNDKMTIPIDPDIDLPGEHNKKNLMAAMLVGVLKGLKKEEIVDALGSYQRPEHRLENAGTYGGVTFYNDSIATIPEACVAALRTLEKVNLLILGGYDRGLDYRILYKHLKTSAIPYILFMGEAGERMHEECADSLSGLSRCYLVDGMGSAFDVIRKELKEGDVCLLSPAAASYGQYKNFEERGEEYKKMAAGLDRPPLL